MARLDACYFCGTAADAPLREVSISPRGRRGDPDATVSVTLCESCEDKLERVLAELFDHVESRRADADAPVDRIRPEETPDEPVAEDDRLDRIDVASGREERDATRRAERPLYSASESDGSPEPSSTDPHDHGGSSAEDAEIIDEEPTVRARATASASESLDGVSVDEYNRVIRLLQNRRFPMSRGAFVDLAANAYDLGEDTVQSVIDAVIDQGTLVERDGELVRPDGDTA